MDLISIIFDISTELITAAITFLFGLAVSKLPGFINKYRIRRFFGDNFFTDHFKIVYGGYSRKPNREAISTYQKVYRDGRTTYDRTMPSKITSQDTMRGISHVLQEFSKYREKPLAICTDEDALDFVHSDTFISIGGPVANEITGLAQKEPGNKFYKVCVPKPQPSIGYYATINESISGKEIFEKPNEPELDYGIIVKVKNNHSVSPGNYFFVCAGIGGLGAAAAAWYLSHCWKQLYRKFKNNEFGIVIKVSRGQDNMAQPVPFDELTTIGQDRLVMEPAA